MGSSESIRDSEKALSATPRTLTGSSDGKPKELGTSVRLRMFSSPLVTQRDSDNQDQDGDVQYPQMKRYEEPTLLEIFYDLFFAATYNAFCDVKQVTGTRTFKASIGYFCLLWLTWFAVTLYEVRFATDSVFSRVATAVQLGALIGFVVVAPKFDPSSDAQEYEVLQSFSLILAVSRAALVVQYSWMLFHLRKHKRSILPLALQAGIYFVAAVVYLGISFAFREDGRNPAYMTWYFISGAEALATLAIAQMAHTVEISSTHLMKRMALLTVMILGEGVESLAKKVITIVNGPRFNVWDDTTRGHLAAAAATIYFVFLVYFDWLGHNFNLPRFRQVFWLIVHLPFHLALVLFMQGFVQLLIWGKISSAINQIQDIGDPSDVYDLYNQSITAQLVVNSINASIQEFFQSYPAKTTATTDAINEALGTIAKIPNEFWIAVVNATDIDDPTVPQPAVIKTYFDTLKVALVNIVVTLCNVIFTAFGIDLQGEVAAKNAQEGDQITKTTFQLQISNLNWERYGLVFAYTYVASGCAVVLLVVLKSISSTLPRRLWAIIRLGIIIALALGTGLTAILWYNFDRAWDFLNSSWVSPTIALVWFCLVVITHINMRPFRRGLAIFQSTRNQRKNKNKNKNKQKKKVVVAKENVPTTE